MLAILVIASIGNISLKYRLAWFHACSVFGSLTPGRMLRAVIGECGYEDEKSPVVFSPDFPSLTSV